MLSPVTFAGSKPNTPTQSKPSSIKGGPSSEVQIPGFDDEQFNKFMAGLDSSIADRDKWLDQGDQFLAGSSTEAPRPLAANQVEVPEQFKKVTDPYHALQAAEEGRFSPSPGMKENLETLIGHTGRDITEVAAEQGPRRRSNGSNTSQPHQAEQTTETTQPKRTGLQKGLSILRKAFCLPD